MWFVIVVMLISSPDLSISPTIYHISDSLPVFLPAYLPTCM